ncbi:MAG: hypothetical protein P4L50_12350 [Anaerolineaceae bacterium]|nr:hypothetical protein [Anaerolineaceae bacterium]
MSSRLRLADPADEASLRKLLRENPMPGAISLSYEREPNYFAAASVDGTFSQTIINVDDETGVCLGMGARIIRPMYLNGDVQEIGYMSHLRVDLRQEWGLSLPKEVVRSFQKFKKLHGDGRVPFYLMSVIADNSPARRLLTAELPGMPFARSYTRMFTYAVSPRRAKKELALPGGLSLQRGRPEHIPEIIACLQRNEARRQFAPYWSAGTLFTPAQTPDLHPEDFYVALHGSRVVGCLALWDQNSFKQTVVRAYHGSMARWRRWINFMGRWIDIPHLPEVNSPLVYAYASHLAIDGDDPQVFSALLRAIYNETIRRRLNYFMIGLDQNNPLRAVLTKSYLHLTYPSQIYLMGWQDGLPAINSVGEQPAGLEISVL